MEWCGVVDGMMCGVVWCGVAVCGVRCVVCGTGQATGQAIIVVHGGSGDVEEGDKSEMLMKMLMSDDEKPEVGSGGDGMGSWIVEGCGLLGTKRVVAAGVECTVGVEGDDDSEGLEVSEELPMQRTLKLGAGCSAMH